MHEKKSFLQELYKALEAEETHDHDTDPTRGSEAFFLATDPPPGGEAENRVQDELTYIDALRGCLPQKDHKALFVFHLRPPCLPGPEALRCPWGSWGA